MKFTRAFSSRFSYSENIHFYFTAAFLFAIFMLGGGSRSDITSLTILRPLSIIVCGLCLLRLNWEHVKKYKAPFIGAALILFLVFFQLIPLPPRLWQSLPDRETVIAIDSITGLENLWRPMSLTPSETWNAFYSLSTPLAVLLLITQLTQEERYKLLPVLIGIGFISGLWGILQIIGDPQGPAYLYDITNRGNAVGLFANRNHQAIFLAMLFPMLAVFASLELKNPQQQTIRSILAVAFGILLIPLILVTGSRAGLAAAVFGIASVVLTYHKPKIRSTRRRTQRSGINPVYLLIGFLAIGMSAITVIMSRAESIDRLFIKDASEDLRFQTFTAILEKSGQAFPWGTGYGSFTDVYKTIEPNALLGAAYFNHAHNDWLELYLTGGLPALILLTVFIVWAGKHIYLSFRSKMVQSRSIIYSRLGGIILVILGFASLFDYPLRVPSLMCVFVIAAIWLHDVVHASNTNDRRI